MKQQTRSILEELTQVMPKQDRGALLESRGNHMIASIFNLLENVRMTYGDEAAGDIERRLVNTIRSKDSAKFLRGIRRLRNEN